MVCGDHVKCSAPEVFEHRFAIIRRAEWWCDHRKQSLLLVCCPVECRILDTRLSVDLQLIRLCCFDSFSGRPAPRMDAVVFDIDCLRQPNGLSRSLAEGEVVYLCTPARLFPRLSPQSAVDVDPLLAVESGS